jgi:hypothetical protein
MNAINENANTGRQSGQDFHNMVAVNQSILRVQAKFRQRLAMKRLERDIEV